MAHSSAVREEAGLQRWRVVRHGQGGRGGDWVRLTSQRIDGRLGTSRERHLADGDPQMNERGLEREDA